MDMTILLKPQQETRKTCIILLSSRFKSHGPMNEKDRETESKRELRWCPSRRAPPPPVEKVNQTKFTTRSYGTYQRFVTAECRVPMCGETSQEGKLYNSRVNL